MPNWRDEADSILKEKNAGFRFKPAQGDNTFRILPGKTEDGKFDGRPFRRYFRHTNIGPNKRFKICGKNARGEGKCWLCDVQLPKMRNSTNPAIKKRAVEMEAKEVLAVQVSVIVGDTWGPPVIWETNLGGNRTKGYEVLALLKQQKHDFISLGKGRNLNLNRTGTGKNDTHYGAIVPDVQPCAVPKHIAAKMKMLSELVGVYSAEEQQAAYTGRDVEEDESGTEDNFESVDTGGGEENENFENTDENYDESASGEGDIDYSAEGESYVEGSEEGSELDLSGDETSELTDDDYSTSSVDNDINFDEGNDSVSAEFEDLLNEKPPQQRRPQPVRQQQRPAQRQPAKPAPTSQRQPQRPAPRQPAPPPRQAQRQPAPPARQPQRPPQKPATSPPARGGKPNKGGRGR